MKERKEDFLWFSNDQRNKQGTKDTGVLHWYKICICRVLIEILDAQSVNYQSTTKIKPISRIQFIFLYNTTLPQK